MILLNVTLNPITLGNHAKGAYLISYAITGDMPKTGAKVFLALGNGQQTLDITGRSTTDVMGRTGETNITRSAVSAGEAR
jgi:hypothetical protein